MPITIGQAQNTFSTNPDVASQGGAGLPPGLSLEATTNVLVKITNTLAKAAQDGLRQSDHISSGPLLASLRPLPPLISPKGISINIGALAYFKYLNDGVCGTKTGSGEYAFKRDIPGRGMVKSVQAWAAQNGIKANNKHIISKHGRTANGLLHAGNAYGIARSILQHGIKPTHFFDKALQAALNVAGEELADGLVTDVFNSLPNF
jgi:hypothetical protein